jgi:uncharacterized membrane protein YkvA (DUF1232 family)
MRNLPPTPTDAPLPRSGALPRPGIAASATDTGSAATRAPPAFDPARVAAFDALLHEIHPDARRVGTDELAGLARWLLLLPEAEARMVLAERVARIEELRRMLDDPDWDARAADRARVRKLIGYLDQGEDLIPDRMPLLGLLDDVLLLELAWPAVCDEAEEYRDYCAWRSQARPAGKADQRRAAWVRDRLDELALWRQRMQVRASHYADVDAGQPRRTFRVS